MALPAAFAITFKAVALSLLIEFVNWLAIFRTPRYKRARTDLDRAGREHDRLQDGIAGIKDKQAKKIEAQLVAASREMYMVNMYSTFISGFGYMAAIYYLTTVYQGAVVAKLPFEPVWLFKKVIQRGLVEPGPSDCSCTFICVLVAMGLKQLIQKALGFAPTRAMSKNSTKGMECAFYHALQGGAKKD